MQDTNVGPISAGEEKAWRLFYSLLLESKKAHVAACKLFIMGCAVGGIFAGIVLTIIIHLFPGFFTG